jgi:hypothetical protein
MLRKFLDIPLIVILVVIFSCKSSTTRSEDFVFPEPDTIPIAEAQKLSDEALDNIVENIGSPVEISSILQRMSVPFSVDYLATTINVDRLSTNFQKALELGIFGADLGYLNMYEKTGTSIDVLSSIKKLADGIRVGQYFDFETIKRLSTNKSNLDSLLYLSIHSYNQIDKYLRDNNRGHLSALMITGVWIEGQYLATQVVKNNPDEILRNRIGEQKIILNDLLLLLKPYCSSSQDFTSLCMSMESLKEKYAEIKISYTLGDPETTEQDGRLVVVQKEESLVEMTDQQLNAIIELTATIRNSLILNN